MLFPIFLNELFKGLGLKKNILENLYPHLVRIVVSIIEIPNHMLRSLDEGLEERIINILAQKSRLSTRSIHKRLCQSGAHTTVQGTYRALRILLYKEVLIKEGQLYSMSIPWITDICNMAQSMRETYMESGYISAFLPPYDGARRSWNFTDSKKLYLFYTQILLSLAAMSTQPAILEYSPTCWLEMTNEGQSHRYRSTLHKLITKSFVVFGTRDGLSNDQVHKRKLLFDKEHLYCLPKDSQDHIEKKTIYLAIIQEYIVTISMSPSTALAIEKILVENKIPTVSTSKHTAGTVSTLGTMKLTLRRSAEQSRKYKKKFEWLFGPIR